MPDIFGVRAALVPAVEDGDDFVALIVINEGPGGLLSLVPGVTLHLNSLKNPLFFHFFFAPQWTQRGKAVNENIYLAENTEKKLLF